MKTADLDDSTTVVYARGLPEAMTFTGRKRMPSLLFTVLGIAGIVIVIVTLVLALQVDNWRRDLFVNHAATDEDSPDKRLHPVHSRFPPDATAELVIDRAKKLPGWQWKLKRQLPGDIVEIEFVRTTPVMRFQDDIRVRITPTEHGSLIVAESRSRVGRGDLGQNPRNLIELLEPVREAVK